MIYLRLFFEFFKVGLFSIGGGLATIPFLTDLGSRTGWFTSGELANMIAISESTPGPMGVNMATYVGFHLRGIPLVILIIAGFLKKFRESRGVDAVFYGIRPASTALIAAALAEVCSIALLNLNAFSGGGDMAALFQWKGILLAVIVFLCLQAGPLKKLHPGAAEKAPPHRVYRCLGGGGRGLSVLNRLPPYAERPRSPYRLRGLLFVWVYACSAAGVSSGGSLVTVAHSTRRSVSTSTRMCRP